jgi:hypothetical protein
MVYVIVNAHPAYMQQDLVISVMCTIGYLCPAIAMAVYSFQWVEPIIKEYEQTHDDHLPHSDPRVTPYICDYVLPVLFTFVSSIMYSYNNIIILNLHVQY